MTRWETMFAGSCPPRVWSRTKPLSSTCLTRNPISSMCAATITRASSRPRLVPITLPKESVRTSSVRTPSSSRAISRWLSSRPGTPGVSISRCSNASLSATSSPLFVRGYTPGSLATARRRVKDAALRFGFLSAALFEQLAGEVEAEAEVVEEIEDREAQDQGVGVGHLQQDRRVAHQPERGERERELVEGDRARRVDVAD